MTSQRLGLGGEGKDWSLYLTLGIVFALILRALCLPRRGPTARLLTQILQGALAGGGVLIEMRLLFNGGLRFLPLIALTQLGLMVAAGRLGERGLVSLAIHFVFLVLAWGAAT